MSGPVSTDDTPPEHDTDHRTAPPVLERLPARTTDVGGISVRRALPRRSRRTVGAWCFVDHFDSGRGPAAPSMAVGPHPHIGLQTVTWLVEGEVLHTDSLGSEQLIRPGQLNLMSAGHGIAHAEQTPEGNRHRQHGAQLWVAQPDRTRSSEPAFAHHGDLPRVELGDGLEATLLVGELHGARSPARTDTPLVGAALAAGAATSGAVVLDPSFEYAIVVLAGRLGLRGAGLDGAEAVVPGELAHLGTGRDELGLVVDDATDALLLGGAPFETEPLMWWNFVARSAEEITAARLDWEQDAPRFGPVRSSLARIPAPERGPAGERSR
jgi:quercetin 2,3-dioxygenase